MANDAAPPNHDRNTEAIVLNSEPVFKIILPCRIHFQLISL
jgi:hypothetical protein